MAYGLKACSCHPLTLIPSLRGFAICGESFDLEPKYTLLDAD